MWRVRKSLQLHTRRGTRRATRRGPIPLGTLQYERSYSYSVQQHVLRRHFYVRDMVEEFEIEVPFVSTANNIADFFTKPMHTSKQFFAFRRIIMNEGSRDDPTSITDLPREPALAHGVGYAPQHAPRSEGGRPQSHLLSVKPT